METIETYENAGFTVSLYQDEEAESPREWDNLGKMVCWHRRSNLGDEQVRQQVEECGSLEAFEAYLERERRAVLILPIYIYEHSGITVTARYEVYLRYPDKRWDAGQVGYIYSTEEKLREEYSVPPGKEIPLEHLDKARDLLMGEVDTYDQYLRGDVYGYVVKDEAGDHVDSCWGFFGLEYAREEAQAALASAANGKEEVL